MVCIICLDTIESPVATPCGHVFCLECLTASSEEGPDAMQAQCPTCRATFSLIAPDPALLPRKYRRFIDSNIRRIYLDNSQEIALREKIVQLESRITSLEMELRHSEYYTAKLVEQLTSQKRTLLLSSAHFLGFFTVCLSVLWGMAQLSPGGSQTTPPSKSFR